MESADQINTSSPKSSPLFTNEKAVKEPKKEKGLLSPVDRISETLYGVIMALTYTCTLKIAEADRTQVRDMLWAAIGCNIAWGLVDGVMYVVTANTQKGHNMMILRFIQKTKNQDKARKVISDQLPPVIVSILKPDAIEDIRQELLKIPPPPKKITSKSEDIFTALGVFVYAFISTFPVVVPFIYVDDDRKALRISNAVAIVMMFFCGWLLGRYAGGKPWLTGLVMSLIGVILVGIAISLGG